MSRHKNHRINHRNWDAMLDMEEAELPMFEPIRAARPVEDESKPRRVPRLRQSFHRPRFG